MHGTIESIYRVEWRPRLGEAAAGTDDLRPQWQALCASACQPNVFYEPAFALPAAAAFGHDVGAGLVWSRASPSRLLGFFPGRIESRRYGVPFPVLVGWTHPFGPLGAPLVDRAGGDSVIAAWLEHVATNPLLPKRWLVPLVPRGPLADMLARAVSHRGGAIARFADHERALLAPGDDRATYMERAVGRRKLKELKRQWRRLGDVGTVTCDTVSDRGLVVKALSDFMDIEAAGWKGRAGTAARNAAAVRTFMESAISQLADDGLVSITRLHCDGRAIAALIMLRSQGVAWAWKIAYDESFEKTSPGVQVLLHATTALLADASITRADSCATANHPMIDHIWRERLGLADWMVRIGPDGGAAFRATCAMETARRAAIVGAKRARDLLRR